jgi:hypothetical protein
MTLLLTIKESKMKNILGIKNKKVAKVIEIDYDGPLTPADYPAGMDNLIPDYEKRWKEGDDFLQEDYDQWILDRQAYIASLNQEPSV